METEPTLGNRILDEVLEYAASIRERETTGARMGLDRLRALCARADAAGRGMVALVERLECRTDDGDLMREVQEEYDNALAAWRAINGEAQP